MTTDQRVDPEPLSADEATYHGSLTELHGPCVVLGDCVCPDCDTEMGALPRWARPRPAPRPAVADVPAHRRSDARARPAQLVHPRARASDAMSTTRPH